MISDVRGESGEYLELIDIPAVEWGVGDVGGGAIRTGDRGVRRVAQYTRIVYFVCIDGRQQ